MVEATSAAQPMSRGVRRRIWPRPRQEHGHGADHQRCVADRGVGQAVKLDKELDGNTEGRRDKQDADLAPGEANPVEQGYRQQATQAKRKR